ncbi:hypothetical protein AOQ84DRAFT_305467, partial [Glonium stellatum]
DTGSYTTGSFSKTRLFGASHWANSIELFELLSRFRYKAEVDKASEIYSLVQKCKMIARTAKSDRLTQQSVAPGFRDYVPPREVSDELIYLYFRTFESIYRVLHIPSFQREYIEYWNNPELASADFVIKLLLVMAIGTCFHKGASNSISLRTSSYLWIHATQSWLKSPFEKARLTLRGLQIYCLLLIARQTHGISSNLVWISAGSLLRTAMNMGLHRDPKHLPKASIFHSELRRRLWAIILEISVQSSLDSGMPPLISCKDFDCEPPANIDDLEMDEGVKVSPVSKPVVVFTQMSVQIGLMRSLLTRLKITQYLNDFRYEQSFDETLRLGVELNNACRSNFLMLQSFPISSTSVNQTTPTASQVKLFGLFTRRFLLALHRPFAIRTKANPTYYFSRKICVESSLLLSPSFPSHLSDSPTQDNDYTQLTILGGEPFRSVFVHATLTLCLELITQLQEDFDSFSSASINSTSRKEIYKAIQESISHAAHRIEVGEMNVKGRIFVSCALGQIDAMQAGTSPE